MQHSEPVDPGHSPLLRATGLGKSFPGVQALSGVDFDLFAGEVHCLIGENGAGKSTLVKILAGVQEADAGTFEVNGKAMSFANPQDSQAAGVACIFQELAVVDGLSVSENILLGDEPGRFGFSTARRRMSWRRTCWTASGFQSCAPASRPVIFRRPSGKR